MPPAGSRRRGPRASPRSSRIRSAQPGVRPVELEHRELGVVLRRDPFVAEVAVDLVDPLEAADHQPLQVQLGRDAQVEVDVERVVVRHERAAPRAARRWAASSASRPRGSRGASRKRADAPRRSRRASRRPRATRGWRRGRGSAAGSGVSTSVRPCHFSGSGRKPLARKRQLSRLDRELARAGAEQSRPDADPVAEVEGFREAHPASWTASRRT